MTFSNRTGADSGLGKIDVCVPSLQPLSEKFVSHLRSRIPIHCLLTSSKLGRGPARQELIEKVDTDWFAFVDDDVRLRPDWWNEVSRMATPGTGGIEGLWSYALTDKRVDDYARSMERLARLLGRSVWKDRIDRAYTGDTLIRTEGVERIEIPDIHIYEDEYIRRFVERAGFTWLRTKEVVCDHLRTYNLNEAYQAGEYAYYFGQVTPLKQIKHLAQLPLRVLFALYYTRNVGIARFAFERETKVLKGVLHAYVNRFSRGGSLFGL